MNSPDKIPVAVISDGKPGHENQSMGIVEHLPGSNPILLRHKLTGSLSESWLRFQARCRGKSMRNPGALLRYAFSEKDIDRLVNHKPMVVVSSGTMSAGLLVLAGKLTGAMTCVCMRPSMLPLSLFDLAVLPQHDNPSDEPNILATLAAPNRVSPELLSQEADKWWPELPSGDKIISWVIGGPSGSANFDETHVLGGLLETLVWARGAGWQVWLSTARRTPETLEDGIAKIAGGYPSLTWHLLWHNDKRNPLYAMFARSRLAIVTSDSVSMVAEAASAGKGPVVYQTAPSKVENRQLSKQDRMVNNLIEKGYGSRASSPEDLIGTLPSMLKKWQTYPVLNDTQRVADRIMEMIRK